MISGKHQIDIVDTGIFGLDGGSMFGVVPKALWKKRYNEGDSENRIPLAAKPLLVQYDDKKVLIDTGNGTKYPEKLQKIYNINIESSNFDNALKPFGLKRSDITDVILTHLHFDHAGGATIEVNGEIQPTFPNAKYYVQKDQYDWGMNPTMKDQGSFMKNDFVPLKGDGLLDIIDGEGTLLDNFHLHYLEGHTKGMQMVRLDTGKDNFLYLCDLCPTTAHVSYPFVMGYDNFPLSALAEKQKYFPIAFEEEWILIFEHDAFFQAAKLEDTGKGFKAGDEIIITEK
jgi:glyoxylase-like metal-dependent hydrolase (beta-lactamase superfamily II)